MDTQSSPSAILHEFIVASVEFYAAHPQAIVALTAVRGNLRRADGRLEFGPKIHQPELEQLQAFMRAAQRAGEMSLFDTRVAAVSLRAALDGAALEASREGCNLADRVFRGQRCGRRDRDIAIGADRTASAGRISHKGPGGAGRLGVGDRAESWRLDMVLAECGSWVRRRGGGRR